MINYSLNPTCSKPALSIPTTKQKKWYVYFVYRNSENKRQQFKVYEGLNDPTETKNLKVRKAQTLITELSSKLREQKFDVDRKEFINNSIKLKPIDEYITEYIAIRKLDMEPNSYRLYRYSLQAFSKIVKGKAVADVTAELIEEYFRDKKFKTATKKYTKHILINFYKWLNRTYKLDIVIPAKDVKMGKFVKTDMHSTLSPTELKNIMDLAEKEYEPAFVLAMKLLLNCLVRPVEITRIKVGNVRLDRNAIYIPIGQGKNRNKSRFLIIDSWFKPYIEGLGIDFSDPNLKDKFLISRGFNNTLSLVGDKQIYARCFARRFKLLRKRLNIDKNCSFYGLKHLGNAILLTVHKIPVSELRIRNGHSSSVMTDIYLRDLQEKAPELLSR